MKNPIVSPLGKVRRRRSASTSILIAALLASAASVCVAQSPTASPAASTTPVGAQSSTAATGSMDDAAMMKQMMELAKTNENHKLLAEMAGRWNYTVKMWMAPSAPPMESTGVGVRKPIMNGRYFQVDYTGKIKMPGDDGKVKDVEFLGTSLEGYDNAKKKFVASWADSMGTGILISEGDYDPATKTFTYRGEMEMVPGTKTKYREVVKVVDRDHHVFEYYEERGGQEAKTMEISYTRAK